MRANFSCPYCGSKNVTAISGGKNSNRGHCNSCFTNISDIAGTVWHKSQLEAETRQALEQEFVDGSSGRQAAKNVGVNKTTACRAFKKLRERGQ